MGNFERNTAIAFAVVLLMLYLLSSTNLILKNQEDMVYRISVIIDDLDDSDWTNYKLGMEKAAEYLNVDVNFVSLYVAKSQEEQMSYMERETLNGADALIVAPVNGREIVTSLGEGGDDTPLIILKQNVLSGKITACLEIDYYSMGMQMGEEIIKKYTGNQKILFAVNEKNAEDLLPYYKGAASIAEKAGVAAEQLVWKEEPELIKAFWEASQENAIWVGMDIDSLNLLFSYMEESGVFCDDLYGNGCNSNILGRLEEGKLKAITVTNDYDMGYLSIELAVKRLKNQYIERTEEIEHYFIRSDEMYEGQYEMVLFPIS